MKKKGSEFTKLLRNSPAITPVLLYLDSGNPNVTLLVEIMHYTRPLKKNGSEFTKLFRNSPAITPVLFLFLYRKNLSETLPTKEKEIHVNCRRKRKGKKC